MAVAFKVPVGVPNLTTTERNALSSPAAGWLIWNTTSGQFEVYNGSVWIAAGSGVTPGGASSNVQYNNGTTFAGNSGFTFDGSGVVYALTRFTVGGGTPNGMLHAYHATFPYVSLETGGKYAYLGFDGTDIKLGGDNTNDKLKVSYLAASGTIVVNSSSQVGIGKAPGYKLDVNGDCNLTTGQVYRINGTQIALANLSDGGNVVSTASSPAAGEVGYFADTSRALSHAAGMVYDPTNNNLTISGTTTYVSISATNSSSSYAEIRINCTGAGGAASHIDFNDGVNELFVGTHKTDSGKFKIATARGFGSPLIVLQRGGNFGVGVDPTTYKFQVSGDCSITGTYRISGTALASSHLSNSADILLRTIVDAKGDLIVGTGADTVSRLASSGTNNDVLMVDTSAGTGLKWAAIGSLGALTWTKYTFANGSTPFNVAALTGTATIFTPAANQVIHAVRIKHSARFNSVGTLCNVSVGVSGNATKYASAFDVFQAVAAGNKQLSSTLNEEDGSTAIIITATSDVNLNTHSTGSVDIWILTSTVS